MPSAPVAISGTACVATLVAHGVVGEATPLPRQSDARCTVADPVRLSALALPDGSHIDLPDKPIVACTTAAIFGDFVGDVLAPLARGTYETTIEAVGTGPGLDCRSRDHIPGAKLSAHANGLALDIERIAFADGKSYLVGRPASDKDRHFDRAVRAAGCGYFNTELGPGSDSYHATHWHFDLLPRGRDGKSKFCE